MKNYIIDTDNKQITFLDNRFYSTENGGYVPSVTTIMNAYPKDAGYFQWLKSVGEDADTIRDEAGRRGSVVHELTEIYDSGAEVSIFDENGHVGFKLSEWSMFERYVDFATRFKPTNLIIEQNYINAELGFAGTLDRVIELDGKKILMDIKTSNAIYDSYWLQLSAYRGLLAAAGTEVDEVAILWLNAKTRTEGKKGAIQGIGWQLVTKADTSNDWTLFKHTQALWLAQNADLQPKKLSYQLSHKK
jgi:hypothetical protein